MNCCLRIKGKWEEPPPPPCGKHLSPLETFGRRKTRPCGRHSHSEQVLWLLWSAFAEKKIGHPPLRKARLQQQQRLPALPRSLFCSTKESTLLLIIHLACVSVCCCWSCCPLNDSTLSELLFVCFKDRQRNSQEPAQITPPPRQHSLTGSLG